MPTEILSFTITTLWPVVLAAIVWLIASQSAQEDDENEKIAGILPRAPQLAARDNNGSRRVHRRASPKRNGRRARMQYEGRLGTLLRVRRALKVGSASSGNWKR